jgi:YfiH family protein
MTPPLFSLPVLASAHGFFTRQGGVSSGPYASLNCSLSSRDSRELVLENRARAASALGARPECLVGLTQVHGHEVVRVDDPWRPGEGPAADAMVTNRPGVALGIVTADCAPVLVEDEAAGVIGAAHAGWRGAIAGVLEAMLDAMVGLGACLERMTAAIGPCIGQASYEVGPDLHEAVLATDPEEARTFFAPGRLESCWQFDLDGYCRWRLHRAGIARVDGLAVDTAAEEDRFFSHRRRTLSGGGPIGHQISAIMLAT